MPQIPINIGLPTSRLVDALTSATYTSSYWCHGIEWDLSPPSEKTKEAMDAIGGWDGRGWTAFLHGRYDDKVIVTDDEGTEHVVTLRQARERIQTVFAEKHKRHLMDIVNEDDDGDTGDVLLQCIALGEVVYG